MSAKLDISFLQMDEQLVKFYDSLGYEMMAYLIFLPVSGDEINCGLFWLYRNTNTRLVFAEVSISAKSAVFPASQDQINEYYPQIRKFLLDNFLPLPIELYGDFNLEINELRYPYTIPE